MTIFIIIDEKSESGRELYEDKKNYKNWSFYGKKMIIESVLMGEEIIDKYKLNAYSFWREWKIKFSTLHLLNVIFIVFVKNLNIKSISFLQWPIPQFTWLISIDGPYLHCRAKSLKIQDYVHLKIFTPKQPSMALHLELFPSLCLTNPI